MPKGVYKRTNTSNYKKYNSKTYVESIKKLRPELIVLEDYVNMLTKIKHRCTYCDSIWITQPRQALNGKQCRLCYKKEKQSTEALFVKKMKKMNPHLELIDSYSGSGSPVAIKHTCGYIFKTTPDRLVRHNVICRECTPVTRGVRAKKTTTILGTFDSSFEAKCAEIIFNKFKNVKFSKPYPKHNKKICDFYIPDFDLWIEVSTYNKEWYLKRILTKRQLVINFFFAQTIEQLENYINHLPTN